MGLHQGAGSLEEGPLSWPCRMVPQDSVGTLVLPQHGLWALLERSVEPGIRQICQTTGGEPYQGFRKTAPKLQTRIQGRACALPFNQSFFTVLFLQAWGTADLDDFGGHLWQSCHEYATGHRRWQDSLIPFRDGGRAEGDRATADRES